MKQDWPTISLIDKVDDIEAAEERADASGTPGDERSRRKRNKRAPLIDNTDPNAAENQPERGERNRPADSPPAVTNGHDSRTAPSETRPR